MDERLRRVSVICRYNNKCRVNPHRPRERGCWLGHNDSLRNDRYSAMSFLTRNRANFRLKKFGVNTTEYDVPSAYCLGKLDKVSCGSRRPSALRDVFRRCQSVLAFPCRPTIKWLKSAPGDLGLGDIQLITTDQAQTGSAWRDRSGPAGGEADRWLRREAKKSLAVAAVRRAAIGDSSRFFDGSAAQARCSVDDCSSSRARSCDPSAPSADVSI